MSRSHGKRTEITVNGTDLSAFTNTSEFTRSPDVHDVTCYGATDHVFDGGLGNGTFTMGGIYDTGVAGPRAILKPLEGQLASFRRRIEGTGAGKPQDLFNGFLTEYVEAAPVAEFVAWNCTLQMSGPVTGTAQ